MNYEVKFYPLGNADTTFIKLPGGRTLLFDFANTRCDDPTDLRCDLPVELDKDNPNPDFDVVGFTHGDIDHVKGFADYFYLEHATKYQSGKRKKIKDLWVPAHVILEQGCEDETRILRDEARHRLRNKSGIKVFSNPESLKDWLSKEGITTGEVSHLIVGAGKTVPGWDEFNSELEFFVHAPFSYHIEHTDINRNDACMVVQATFKNSYKTKLLLLSDAKWDLLHEIVAISEHFGNTEKLYSDIHHISHHCSYLSLAAEKGETVTTPVDPVRRLLEEYCKDKVILISPSCPIPIEYDSLQPPHRQAFNYYKSIAELKNGEIKVTMEFPSKDNPSPITLIINNYGATIIKTVIPSGFVSQRQPPKAG